MPWKESRIVDQRLQFLSSYQKEEMSVSELCREFGVSRPTGYRWINRYKESGPEGLLNFSSNPSRPSQLRDANALALKGLERTGDHAPTTRGDVHRPVFPNTQGGTMSIL